MTRRGSLSYLRLLCVLRWLAVVGQLATILWVSGPMHIPLALQPLVAGVLGLAAFNTYVSLHLRRARSATDLEVFSHLLVDILVLAWLVGFSGGIENPFASLFLLPIALGVLALSTRGAMLIAALSVLAYGLSTYFGVPLAPLPGLFSAHQSGMLATFIISAGIILVFFTRMAAERHRQDQDMAAMRESFARNEGILALATHAASVAHELNTPLATLTLLVDELLVDASSTEQRDDYLTLKKLVDVCSDRVQELAMPPGSEAADIGSAVDLDSVIERWQLVRPSVQLQRGGSIAGFERVDAAIGHLLQALLNNAADASEKSGSARVDLDLNSDARGVRGTIRDYGVGFDEVQPPLPAVLFRTSKRGGLGIGLALSHATVERLGGRLSMQATGGQGVQVEFSLPVHA